MRPLTCISSPRRCLLWVALVASMCAGALLPTETRAQAGDPVPAIDVRALRLEDVELSGATRTSRATVLQHLALAPGQPIDQPALVAAVEQLRARRLFESVEFYTKPGSERGRLVLVLEVKEHGTDFRWALGNTDLDGWYLVPAMLAWDNVTGRADFLDLQWRLGFRHSALQANYYRPYLNGGRDYWGLGFDATNTHRPWFEGGVEYWHKVDFIGLGTVFGRRFTDSWTGELGLRIEGVDVADCSEILRDSEDGTLHDGDQVCGDDLAPAIGDAVGQDGRVQLHVDLQHDTRSDRLRAGSPVAGLWGRLRVRGTLQESLAHVGLQGDLRHYAEVPGGVMALRLRGSVVSDKAPFYDRLYLGGMYSVRGFPSNSLSAPGGDTWLWSSSLEYRSCILPDRRGGTRLAGIFFVDAGASGTFDAEAYPGISAGAGYGVRWKVWWLDWIGLDVGFPLTERPLDHRFQVTASIGWSF